jgi:chromosomal replication initiation ATPase DnaA
MKFELFNQYASEVCKVFNVYEGDIFKKNKEASIVDARYLLYYLCSKNKIQITYIQKYMKERGYDIPHSTIHYGINQVKRKVHEDKDYQIVIDRISRCTI